MISLPNKKIKFTFNGIFLISLVSWLADSECAYVFHIGTSAGADVQAKGGGR